MKKPPAKTIRDALPLTKLPAAGDITRCTVCGVEVDPADLPCGVWRECDEHDIPIPGPGALVFLGTSKEHEPCRKALSAHPRLYEETTGVPGHFPRLCGPCVHRRGVSCAHPHLTANGGSGLSVSLHDPFRGAIFCGRGGQIQPVRRAIACAGRRLLAVVPGPEAER